MARDLTTAVLTAATARRICTCHLLTVYLDGLTIYWCDYGRDVEFDGNSYSHAGGLLGFDGLEESSDLSINSVTVSLSGVDTTAYALILSYAYLNRRLTIHRAFFNENDVLIGDPSLIFDGRIISPAITENQDDNTAVLSVEASNQFSDFDSSPGRHTADSEQQVYFPGDKGFEYATETDETLTWGG